MPIKEIKDRLSLADIVRPDSHHKLHRASRYDFKCLCPFHSVACGIRPDLVSYWSRLGD